MKFRAKPLRNNVSRLALGTGIALAALAGGAYIFRAPLARQWIDATLQKNNIKARYDIATLEHYGQRLEHVVVGDAAHPDLTADVIETETALGLTGMGLNTLKVTGLHVHGVLDKQGNLHFGSLDHLRSTDNKPFTLPDMGLDLSNAHITLDTPYGVMESQLNGQGNLAHDFKGKLALNMNAAQFADAHAQAQAISAQWDVRSHGSKISAQGPVHIAKISSAQMGIAALTGMVMVTTDSALKPSALFDLTGTPRGLPEVLAQNVRFKGSFVGVENSAHGLLVLGGFRPAAQIQASVGKALQRSTGTPAAQLASALGAAIKGLDRGSQMTADWHYAGAAQTLSVLPRLQSVSGASATVKGKGITVDTRTGAASAQAQIVLQGGGFPNALVDVAGTWPKLTGRASFAPLVAQQSLLRLTPLQFSTQKGTVQFSTQALVDAPVSGGMVHGLSVPIAGILAAGGVKLNAACTPLKVQHVQINALSLGQTAATLCKNAQGIQLNTPHIVGRYNGQSLSIMPSTLHYSQAQQQFSLAHFAGQWGGTELTGEQGRYDMAHQRFSLQNIHATMGEGGQESSATMASVTGSMNGASLSGDYQGAAGMIAPASLMFDKAAGAWQFSKGTLTAHGQLMIADADQAKRFEPLSAPDMAVKFAHGILVGSATLHSPKSGAFVSQINLNHQFSTSAGGAEINIVQLPLLSFNKALHLEDLTRIAKSSVQDLDGQVSGQGRIHWNTQGVTSDGDFETERLNLSASFGPVSGIQGKVHFTDLLGGVTAPHQHVRLAVVNPGVMIRNGEIWYSLQPGNKAVIEGGTFPFAGGVLLMEPATLDLTESATRRMTFRVEGVEAGKLIAEYQFENIAATGTFDGVLPMVFDANGARIEAGQLHVRDEGGTVSYIGPVTNAALGRFSRIAFDALKSIKYRGLIVDISGPLDGEMVSLVKFSGTNQAPLSAQRSYFLKQITGIPFKFNIRIQAPFRSLFNSAMDLQDPSSLVQRTLPTQYKVSAPAKPAEIKFQPVHPPATSVQPKERQIVP